MLGVWMLESIYWVKSLFRQSRGGQFQNFHCHAHLGYEMFQEEEQLEMNEQTHEMRGFI